MRLAPLQIGLRGDLFVREERVSPRYYSCRLLYASDIHLRRGRSEMLSRQVWDAVARCRPDLVLFGGDLVDRRSELGRLRDLVRTIGAAAPVMAVGGNHDQRVGLDDVRQAVIDGGGEWIHNTTVRVRHGRRVIVVSGPEARPPRDGDVRVLCAHNPRVWRTSREAGYDLVLAGHLHGFQLVACEFRDRLFPGALFYPYCFLSRRRGRARLVVSRGISDLLPIRWRCPREVVLCHV